ncbi:hypothetical protein [Candidatus Cyanaurora vandensis]|uniref:hypothetical protein n=1 Tax=Candidatus Cyanaurora vandensis TaxID=2714958 RepID=UPI00257AE1F8|nr:hypothetical protein [Candidatus Cyanaurora vandensis]
MGTFFWRPLLLMAVVTCPVVAKEIQIPLGGQADRIAVAGNTVLVGVVDDQSLVVVDLLLNQVKQRIPLGFEPLVVVYNPKTQFAYVGGAAQSSLAVIDLQKNAIVADIDLGAGVYDLALDVARQRLIATHPVQQRVSLVNLKTQQVRRVELPQPALACGVITKTGTVVVSLSRGPLGLVLIDPDTGEALAQLPSGNGTEDIVIDDPRNRAILLNAGSEDLSVVPLTLGAKARTIGLDWKPTRLALSADGNLAYVTSRDHDRLQIVDLTQGRVIETHSLDRQPTGIALLENGSYIVVEAGAQTLHWNQTPLTLSPPVLARGSAIAGVVKDLAGKPVTAGDLQVQGRTVKILPDGSFVVPRLPAGKYELIFKVPGFPDLKVPVQTREGYVRTQEIQLPPRLELTNALGIGFLPAPPLYSDLLARRIIEQAAPQMPERPLKLLKGPLGPAPEFKQFAALLKDLTFLDRDGRFTADLEQLKAMGRTLNLRHLVITEVQSSRGYDTRGNPLLNSLLKFFVPFVPFDIPNPSPNQLRTQGLAVIVDLLKARVGDKAVFWQSNTGDDTGGEPLFEEAADGLFRQEILRLGDDILRQWQQKEPFKI